jgi:DMSO/TMAO reductase YedYZ molybdopterin-dependent catalytic subunit
MKNRTKGQWQDAQAAAGNGLLDRRAFLRGGAAFAVAITGYSMAKSASAEPLSDDPWSKAPGAISPSYEKRSRYEDKLVRTLSNPNGEPRTQHARTPHHLLNGTFTPNGLHFTIIHGGTPDIDPDKHRLVIHGLVKQPLVFTLDTLARYPMVSRMTFVECGGNSAPFFSKEPIQASVQALHGLVSCAEWTGVRLSTLLEETGIDPKAKWFIAEGADAPALSRSVPVKKALDDAMIALYQNGERIMPGNGYPMRLLLPGYEGNMNIKFLRLGASGAARAGAKQSVYAIPSALEMEWRSRDLTKPRVGRIRRRATDPRADRRRARREQRCPARNRLSRPTLQRHHDLGRRREGRGETCLRVSLRRWPSYLCSRSSPALPSPKCRISVSPSIRPTSPPGISASCLMAPASRPAAARRLKARPSMCRNA